MSLEFKGGMELRGDITRMVDVLRTDGGGGNAATNRILETAAQPVLEQMIQNAGTDPRPRSGELRGALRVKKASGRRGARVTVGVHRADGAAYGVPVEFGHGGPHPAPPHPFVRPAFDAKAEEAYEKMKKLLNEALDKRGLL